MGKYTPSPKIRRRSISETLDEAESEHFLDCPNASFGPRLAALLLDTIFLFLLLSGIEKIISVLTGIFVEDPFALSPSTHALIQSIKIALMVVAYHYSQIWAVVVYGASPAKLILGLRVVHASTGQNLSLSRALLREALLKPLLFVLTAGLGSLAPWLRADHLAFHDMGSKSVVKRVRPA